MKTHLLAHLSRSGCGDLGQYFGPRERVAAVFAHKANKARKPFHMVLRESTSDGDLGPPKVVLVVPRVHSWVT